MFKKMFLLACFLFFFPFNHNNSFVLADFEEWKEERLSPDYQPVDVEAVAKSEIEQYELEDLQKQRIEEDQRLKVELAQAQIDKAIGDYNNLKNKAKSEILEKYIGIFAIGLILILIAGILSLLEFLYSKIKGKGAEGIDKQSGMMIASKTRRLINFSIDQFFLISGLFTGLMLLSINLEWTIFLNDKKIVYAAGVFIAVFYYFFFEALFLRTPGKFITRTKVLIKDGGRPGLGDILARTFVRLVPFELFSFLGSNPLGWHDRWSDTIVVRSSYQSSRKTEKEQKIKEMPRLAELNKQKWFRTLKIAYILSIIFISPLIFLLTFNGFILIDELVDIDDLGNIVTFFIIFILFLFALCLLFLFSELIKRVFYYIYFGNTFLKEDIRNLTKKKP